LNKDDITAYLKQFRIAQNHTQFVFGFQKRKRLTIPAFMPNNTSSLREEFI
jgi:hypothetical protein